MLHNYMCQYVNIFIMKHSTTNGLYCWKEFRYCKRLLNLKLSCVLYSVTGISVLKVAAVL